jgi:hypothetical protein
MGLQHISLVINIQALTHSNFQTDLTRTTSPAERFPETADDRSTAVTESRGSLLTRALQ